MMFLSLISNFAGLASPIYFKRPLTSQHREFTERITAAQFERFPKKESWLVSGIAMLYLLWVWAAVGLRSDHFVFISLCIVLYFACSLTRKLVMALIFFAVYWVIYDSMRVYPNHLFNSVSIRELYELEQSLFGFHWQGQLVTPNEYFAQHLHPVLDVLSGLFYLCWVPVPMAFAVWLYFKNKRMLLDFSLAFLLTNLFGFALYYLYPAAPPWYVELYGFSENFEIPGNEAGLARFDEILGVELFHNMYTRNANVFAAIPSLHAAYPMISLYFALRMGLGKASRMFLIILAGIWFSAVYSRHHYIIDVALGVLCAIATIIFYTRIILKTRINHWLDRYSRLIT